MKIHMVKKGDTLFQIAKKYGVELEQLIAANSQIADPNQLDVGMKVKIPSIPKTAPLPAVEYKHKHTVSQGDTLWKLAKAWDVPLKAMIEANTHLKNPNILMTGETIYVPKVTEEGATIPVPKQNLVAPKAELTAPIEENIAPKAELTAPIADTVPKAELTAPIVENPAPKAELTAPIEKPPEPKVELTAPIEEAPKAPPVPVKPPLPVIPEVKAVENKPADKLKASVNPQPNVSFEQYPPVVGSKPMENQLPEWTPNPTPEVQLPVASKDTAVKSEGLCPPLPEFTMGAGSGYPNVPVYPGLGAGAGAGDPFAFPPNVMHPFMQAPIPPVQAGDLQQQLQLQAQTQAQQLPAAFTAPYMAYNPYGFGYPMPYQYCYGYGYTPVPMQLAMAGSSDCGCGGASIPNLPYALAPVSGEAPKPSEAAASDNSPPAGFGAAQAPGGMPYTVSPYTAPHLTPYTQQAGMVPSWGGTPTWPGQQVGYPFHPAVDAAQPLQTYATPYVNPYAFPTLDAAQAAPQGAGPAPTTSPREQEETEIADEARPAKTASSKGSGKSPSKKSSATRSASKPKSEKAILHSFIERQRRQAEREDFTEESRPWINL